MGFMFMGAKLFNQPLDSWNISQVTNMTALFYQASTFSATPYPTPIHSKIISFLFP
jgi:surface protein